MLPWSKAKPYPHDLIVQPAGGSAVGVRLKAGQDGQMVGVLSQRLDAVSPTTYDLGSLNPRKETPFVFGPLTGGVGESEQETTRRYKYGRRIDCSIGGERRAGPFFTGETVVAGEPVNGFAVGVHDGQDTLFALAGKYVHRFTAGAWVDTAVPFVSGLQWLQAVQFQGSAGSGRLWATNNAGELWGYDGAAWAKATLPAGAVACYVEKVGDTLVIASGATLSHLNEVRVCTSGDPMLAASWGGAIYVGDYGRRITWVRAIGTQAFYFKEDGIFTITNEGGTITVNDLFPDLRNATAPNYGRNAAAWKGYVWFQFGESFWRMDADANLDPIGPERLLGLDPRLRRPITAFAGHGTWFGYAVSQATDLLKFGEWVNPGSSPGAEEFADVWNGSLADWGAKAANAAIVTDAVDGTPWLLVGFTDGSVERTALPQYSPDPADDSRCQFVTGGTGEESYLEWPNHHANAQPDDKHFRAFAANGSLLDATRYVTVSYAVDDPDAAFTDLGTNLTVSGQKVNTPGTVAGKVIRVKESLHGTRTSTPKVSTVVLHEQVRPALQIEYRCRALARHHAPRRDGMVDRRTAEQVRRALQATAGPGPTTIWFPDGTNQDVDFVDYGEAIPNPDARWGLEWEIPLTFVQWKFNTVYGIVDRMVHAVDAYAGYDVDQLVRV